MHINQILKNFFLSVKPTRSQKWRERILNIAEKKSRTKNTITEKEIKNLIKAIHAEEDKKLFIGAVKKMLLRDRILSNDIANTEENIKDINQELQVRFVRFYDNERGNEEQFINSVLVNIINDFKRKNYPFIEEKIHLIQNDNIGRDKKDEPIIQTIKKPMIQSLQDLEIDTSSYNVSPHDQIESRLDGEESKNYLSELASVIENDPKAQDSFYCIYKHLIITQPRLLKERKLPNILHTYPAKEFIYKQYEFLKDIDQEIINIPGYLKHYAIINADERYFMVKSIDVLKKCRRIFEAQLLPELLARGRTEKEIRNNIPLLSAVAVDKNGTIIRTAFKGEKGCLDNHCEYTLFEEILTEIDKQKLLEGTLYVTLEPCNKRGYFIDINGIKKPKIPCAVRCVMSGIKRIYIGSFDPNKKVEWKGVEILETGRYTFQTKNGKLIANDLKETESATLLKDEFDVRGYQIVEETKNKIIYQIGKPVDVSFFHPDLSIEIMILNKDFIGDKSEQAFPLSKMLK